MSNPNYVDAFKVLKEHHDRLCAGVATEILRDRARSAELLDEILDEYARKFYAVGVVSDNLVRTAARLGPRGCSDTPIEGDQPPQSAPSATPLKIATLHCRADIIAETVNDWLAKHTHVDVLSINFTYVGSSLTCLILHRRK